MEQCRERDDGLIEYDDGFWVGGGGGGFVVDLVSETDDAFDVVEIVGSVERAHVCFDVGGDFLDEEGLRGRHCRIDRDVFFFWNYEMSDVEMIFENVGIL